MRIVLGVRKQQQQQREQQQKQAKSSVQKGEEGEHEETPTACASLQPNPPPPSSAGEDDEERKKKASAAAAPVSAEASESSAAAKKPLKASKKRGRKSPSPLPAAPSAPGEVVPGSHASEAAGKKLPPSQEKLSSPSSEGASSLGRKRKHPPHNAGKPKTGDEVVAKQAGGSKPAAKKKARHPPQQQGHDRKVVADGGLEALCSSSSSLKARRKMGGGEKYRPREPKAERDGDRLGSRRAESPGPERDDDPAADDLSTGRPEESGAIDVIRYGDSAIDRPEDEGDENNDPAAADLGSSRRQHSSSAVASSSSSSSSSSASLRRRRRPGGFGIGGQPTSSAAGLASAGPAVSSAASQTDFEEALKKRGFEMAEQEGDGNCLFRAVSLQVYGDANNHREVRRRCLDFMARDEQHFSQFITDEPFREYIQRKRRDGVHGNNPEIQAISELYNRPVEVFVPDNGAKPINIFHAEYKTADAPIRLSYHDGNHYNAVVDPLLPTAGLGLGLPGLEPGLADRLQLEKAKEESEIELAAAESSRGEMDRALEESRASVARMYDKQKAMAMSDLEATDYELERAVLESSMESYRRTEMGRKQGLPRGVAAASMSSSSSSSSSSAHHHHRGRRGPRSASPPTSSSAAFAASAAMSSAAVAAPAPPAAAAASAQLNGGAADRDEYPASVQELVMNGFELSKVLRAYDLVGDNFDALLSVLMSSGN